MRGGRRQILILFQKPVNHKRRTRGVIKYKKSRRTRWREYSEKTGFLFDTNNEENGYYVTRLDAMAQEMLERPAYGGWAIASGEFDLRYRGPEIAVSVPRAQNSKGVVTGKVACRSMEI